MRRLLLKAIALIYARIMVRTARYGRYAWLVRDHSAHAVILCNNEVALRLGLSRRMFSIFFREDDARKYAREIRLRIIARWICT